MQNQYLDLFNTNTTIKDPVLFYTQIAFIHNALGYALKQLIVLINKNLEQNNNHLIIPNPESKSHSNISSTNSQIQSKKQKWFKPKQIKQNSKSNILKIDQIQSESQKQFQQIYEKPKQIFRNKFTTQTNLNDFMEQNSNISQIKKPIYRQGVRHNNKKQQLQKVECQMCKSFYGALQDNNLKNNKLCKHTSRHKTTASFTNIRNFSQQFDDF